MKAEDVFVAEPKNRLQPALSAQCVDQLKQSIFALTTDHIVDVLCIERGIGIERWEVAAPDDAHVGAEAANLAARLHGGHHLRPWHTGNTQKLNLVNINRAYDGCGGIILQITV